MDEKRTAYKQAMMSVYPALRNDIDNYVYALETRLQQLETAQQSEQADGKHCSHCDMNSIYDGCCVNCGTPEEK